MRLTETALERRVKRWLLEPRDCFVQCAPGLGPTLNRELELAGFAPTVTERAGALLRLDNADMMRANLILRTASRVLLRLDEFHAANREALFDHLRRFPWEVQLGFSKNYRLHVTSRNSRLQAGDEVLKTATQAVARRMREFGLAPVPDDDSPLQFHLRLQDDRCTLSFNTSGEHLHRRGFRTLVGQAPVRETIAAALALDAYVSGEHRTVVDPFCGSGVMLLELADVAGAQPPGRGRSFAFEHAAWFRPGRWRDVMRQESSTRAESPELLGFDTDAGVLASARANLEGLPATLHDADATRLDYGELGGGLIISNLPWGVRLGDRESATRTTKKFLDAVARSPSPWDLALLMRDPALLRQDPRFTVRDEQPVASGGLTVWRVTARSNGAR